jgi:FAD synthase
MRAGFLMQFFGFANAFVARPQDVVVGFFAATTKNALSTTLPQKLSTMVDKGVDNVFCRKFPLEKSSRKRPQYIIKILRTSVCDFACFGVYCDRCERVFEPA